jgi:glycosyltransferase involved in cell wall biosynthesis
MKVAFGQRIQDGPWGGGNRFAGALAKALRQRGDQVLFGLDEPDIDLILITDPRARNPAVCFTPGQVFRYLRKRPNTLVVHRINECDERKGTRTMNFRLRLANLLADHTVFIGSWLTSLRVWRREGTHSVILNGGDERIFNAARQQPWTHQGPLRLVTHHWGAHARKGFDVYRRLDELLERPGWRERLAFTYIGNRPAGYDFRNIRQLAPLNGESLADELRAHHVYITASLNEPAGMHHIEGALCGLPLLYRNSGALPEYCKGFGVMFEGPEDVEQALEEMLANYDDYRSSLASYDCTNDRMCARYLALFDEMAANREAITKARRLWRDPLAALLIQLPL